MKTKAACDATGLTRKSLLLYEEKGLIAPEKRWSNGREYREYSEEIIRELRQIAVLRKAWFTMDEIRRMKERPEEMPEIFGAYYQWLLAQREELEELLKAAEDLRRTVTLYERRDGVLTDVTEGGEVYGHIAPKGSSYTAGGAGLYATAEDYDHFAHMLAADGEWHGRRILKEETVRQMRTDAKPGQFGGGAVWGLGMMIRQDPSAIGSACPAGAYGWSGAFGTHFVIDPSDGTSFVWVTNRTDLNGSGSYISAKMEELVFGKE